MTEDAAKEPETLSSEESVPFEETLYDRLYRKNIEAGLTEREAEIIARIFSAP